MHRCIHITVTIFLSTHPLFPSLLYPAPYCITNLSLYLHTWRSCFFCSWCEYPSTLVPGLLSTVLPLLLPPPQDTRQIKIHIYIDDINNISRPFWYSKCNFAHHCLQVTLPSTMLIFWWVFSSVSHLHPLCPLSLVEYLRLPFTCILHVLYLKVISSFHFVSRARLVSFPCPRKLQKKPKGELAVRYTVISSVTYKPAHF